MRLRSTSPRTILRELIFGAYRVFYRVGSAVEVLSVRHGSQLIRAHEVCED